MPYYIYVYIKGTFILVICYMAYYGQFLVIKEGDNDMHVPLHYIYIHAYYILYGPMYTIGKGTNSNGVKWTCYPI